MKLHILFGQRKESYQNELAPEALVVVDEFTNEENPDYIIEKKKFYAGINEFESLEIVDIETGAEGFREIKNRLCGSLPAVSGKVV